MQTVFWTQHLSIYMLQLMHAVCTALDSTQWLVASAEVCREHCFCDAVCFSFCERCEFVPICFLFLTVSLDGDSFCCFFFWYCKKLNVCLKSQNFTLLGLLFHAKIIWYNAQNYSVPLGIFKLSCFYVCQNNLNIYFPSCISSRQLSLNILFSLTSWKY